MGSDVPECGVPGFPDRGNGATLAVHYGRGPTWQGAPEATMWTPGASDRAVVFRIEEHFAVADWKVFR